MKKLLLLALVMLGGVVNVSATDIKKMIFVIADDNFVNNKKGDLAFHAWNEDGDLYGSKGTSTEVMTRLGASRVWFKVIEFDENKSYTFLVYDSGNTAWESSVGTQKSLSSSNSDIYYYNFASSSSNALNNGGDVSFYAYYAPNGSTFSNTALTTTDNVNYTLTLDNQTSYNSAYELLIAPSFVISNYASSDERWGMMYRPNDSEQAIAFTSKTDALGGYWANSNSMKLSAPAYYNLTFKPFNGSNGTFSISPYFTKTISSAGYATFASDYAVAIPDGVTASYATGVSGNVLDMTDFEDGIPANTGALLYKAGGGTVTFTPAASTDEVSGNLFVRGAGTTIPQSDAVNEKTNYILTTKTVSGEKTIGFYKANSDGTNTVATDKAYLSIPDAYAPARGYLTFGEDETTSIESLKETKTVDAYYNLNGQRINQPTKGLYIVNGKKVVIK